VYLALYARRAWVIFDHPYNAESALLAHLMPGIAGCAQINHSGVLPRGTTTFGFWHPRRRRDQKDQEAGRAYLGCGLAVGRCSDSAGRIGRGQRPFRSEGSVTGIKRDGGRR
jgi:hypothetical protein